MRNITRGQHLLGLVFIALLAPSIAGCIIEQSSSGAGGGSGTGGGSGGGGGAGNGGASSTSTGGFVAPDSVQVEILGATIALSPNGQQCWDGACSLTQDDFNKVAEELAKTGDPEAVAAGVATALAGYANSAYGPPDPLGRAQIWDNGSYGSEIGLATKDNNYEDTFSPVWPGDPATMGLLGWQRPFTKDWRARVELTDEDLVNDDSIGVVEIGYEDVVSALKYGKVYPVRVAEQGNGSVLFIHISAHAL